MSLAIIHLFKATVLFIALVPTCTIRSSAFVQPPRRPRLGLSVHKRTNLYSRTSPNAPGLKGVEPDRLEESFDPFNYAENKNDELIPADEKDDGNHDIGLWWARGLLLVVAVLWGTNFASVKYLETLCFHPPCVHPPSEAALARFGLAGIVSLPLLINQPMSVVLAGLECNQMQRSTVVLRTNETFFWQAFYAGAIPKDDK
jgi:hypothetical protein